MKYRVMVVDDSKITYSQVKKMLQDSDYEVVSHCRTGEEALAVYEVVQPDVVTMDIVLPGMDGLDAAQLIRERWPQACIVMASSLAYDNTIDAAVAIGAAGFLFKPFKKEGLLEALRSAIAKKAASNSPEDEV